MPLTTFFRFGIFGSFQNRSDPNIKLKFPPRFWIIKLENSFIYVVFIVDGVTVICSQGMMS